jgi:hypothetical protein
MTRTAPSTDNRLELVPRDPSLSHQAVTLSATTNGNGPSRPGGGPASKTHEIPPRPKPGRKPATEAPETKRKAQNRTSQRAFRERKQKNTAMLLQQVAAAKQAREDEFNKRLRDAEAYQALIREAKQSAEQLAEQLAKQSTCKAHEEYIHLLESNLSLWEDAFYRLKAGEDVSPPVTASLRPMQQGTHDFHSHFRNARDDAPLQSTQTDCRRCTPEHCACIAELTEAMRTPEDASAPMDGVFMTGAPRDGHENIGKEMHPHVEYELDFTHKFRSAAMEENKITDCGFCEGQKDICICDPPPRVDSADEAVSLTRMASGSSAEDVKPNMAMTGPGSCADCQSNPQQRAWCQRVAQLRSDETPSSSRRNSSKSSSLDIMEPKVSTRFEMSAGTSSPLGSGRTVGCSDTFKLLDGRVSTDPNAMDWRQLKPIPQTFGRQDARRDTFTMEPGTYSAMELDASSILTTLQHAQRPLRIRPSDGPHAPLVEAAEERRRASFSPMDNTGDHNTAGAGSHYNIGP